MSGETEQAVRSVLSRLDGLNRIRGEVDTRIDRADVLREMGRASLDAASRVARDTYEQKLAVGVFDT